MGLGRCAFVDTTFPVVRKQCTGRWSAFIDPTRARTQRWAAAPSGGTAIVLATLVALGELSCAKHRESGRPQERATDIYADASWYRDRPEPEAMWEGRLEVREAVIGPGSRLGLHFRLVTREAALDVYAAGVREKFAAFVDRRVVVRAKLIDLASEGFGQELWVASIRLRENDR